MTEKLIALIESETGISSVSVNTELDQLGMDSLDFLCLMREVCNRFKEIPEIKWAKFNTVGDILAEIE